jgi:Domain of unknown function (DUF4129)
MTVVQLPLRTGLPSPSWSHAAIHDTVAAIVRQPAYRRDVGSTLFDRMMQWLWSWYERFVAALGGVPHGRFIATAAAVLVVLLVLARFAYAARLRAGSTGGSDIAGAIVRRGGDPWHAAQRLAAEGQYTEAAHELYRATLALLASHGFVRLHESKTTGDYARELRRRDVPAYAPFRQFGARYDRIIYGTGVCDAAAYDALLSAARAVVVGRHGERAA